MSKKNQGIEIFLRVRPIKKPYEGLGNTFNWLWFVNRFEQLGLRNLIYFPKGWEQEWKL